MKIIENTPNRLVLRQAPWILGCLLIVGILVYCSVVWGLLSEGDWRGASITALFGLGLFGLAFLVMVRQDELILDRPNGIMQFRKTTVFGRKSDEFDLSLLEKASTQTSTMGSGKANYGYRLALILKDHPRRDARTHPTKDIRLGTPVYSGGKDAQNAAKVVNQWLEG